MKKLYAIILLLLFYSGLFAGVPGNKNLKALVDSLNEVVRRSVYIPGNYPIELASRAISISQSIGYKQGEATAREMAAVCYNFRHQNMDAINELYKYIEINELMNSDTGIVNGYQRIGGFCVMLGSMDMALDNFNKAYRIALGTGKKQLIGIAEGGYSTYYYKEGNYPLSMLFCSKSLSNLKGTDNKEVIARNYRKMGDCLVGLNRFERSLSYYDSSIMLFHELGRNEEIANDLTRIAHVWDLKKNYEKALRYNFEALTIRRDENIGELVGSSLANIGVNYMLIGQRDSSLYYLKEAEGYLETSENYHLYSYVLKNLYTLYKQKKDIINSLYYLEQYLDSHDRKIEQEDQAKITAVGVKKLISEHDRTDRSQKEEIRKKNLQLVLISGILFLIIFILIILSYFLRKIRKERDIKEKLNISLENEVAARKRLEESLRISEQQYRFISEHSPDLIMREDLLYKKRFVSPSCRNILGYNPEEIINKTGFLDYIHPDSMHEWLAGIVELKTKKIPTRIVFRARRKNGSLLWAECLINPVLRDGELFEMVSVIRDITERIEYQEEIEEHARNKELLMREVHHRVKNNLSILLSLIRMHKFSITNIRISELLDDLQFRVQTMAMVHRQLQESRNIDELSIGPYLSGLVRSVMKAFDSNHVEVESYFHEEMVHVDILLPLGLIVNELLTNIFKHAFPHRTPGHIWIRYERNGEEDGCLRKLIISDNGIGFPENFDFFSAKSLGSQLVCQLTQQLNGKIEVTSENGTAFTLTLPVRAGKNAGLIKEAQ